MAKIKDLPRVDRPREKLLKYGTDKLSDVELLAIILKTGIKGLNVIELAISIIKKFGGGITNVKIEDLEKIRGLGKVKATEIVASLEFGRRFTKINQKIKLLTPDDIFNSFKYLQNLKKENFIVVYLDIKSQEIAREIISVGTIDASIVHPREVFEPAVRYLSSSVILIHNHPSGNPDPSNNDRIVTENMIKSGKIMGIDVVDHIIIGKSDFFSFRTEGLIK